MPDDKEIAKIALAHEAKIKTGFARLLAEAGIEGWELARFEIRPKAIGLTAVGCPPGQVYDCRWVNGAVVCGCFPQKP